MPIDGYRPLVGGNKPGDHADGGGLARAIRAEQADHFALLDIERDIPDRTDPAKGLGNSLNGDHGVDSHRPPDADVKSRAGRGGGGRVGWR